MSKKTRGIFTGKDVEYLRGNAGDLAERTEYNRRQEIRDRFIQAMDDMKLAYFELPEEDRRKIRENHSDELELGLQSLTAFCHESLTEEELRRTIEQGITSSAKRADPAIYNTTLEMWDHDRRPLEHDLEVLKDRLEAHGRDSLSDAELGRLAREGLLSDN